MVNADRVSSLERFFFFLVVVLRWENLSLSIQFLLYPLVNPKLQFPSLSNCSGYNSFIMRVPSNSNMKVSTGIPRLLVSRTQSASFLSTSGNSPNLDLTVFRFFFVPAAFLNMCSRDSICDRDLRAKVFRRKTSFT